MKEILYFHLKGCPYCRQADMLIEEVKKSNPKYSEIVIKKIEERDNSLIADAYDYYYVPCFFVRKRKMHEGPISKVKLEKLLDDILNN